MHSGSLEQFAEAAAKHATAVPLQLPDASAAAHLHLELPGAHALQDLELPGAQSWEKSPTQKLSNFVNPPVAAGHVCCQPSAGVGGGEDRHGGQRAPALYFLELH